jgi:hypothetical protein
MTIVSVGTESAHGEKEEEERQEIHGGDFHGSVLKLIYREGLKVGGAVRFGFVLKQLNL